ncbi:MAG: hypothetical protein R3C01_14225 [Planctomycetaceae bacterium]
MNKWQSAVCLVFVSTLGFFALSSPRADDSVQQEKLSVVITGDKRYSPTVKIDVNPNIEQLAKFPNIGGNFQLGNSVNVTPEQVVRVVVRVGHTVVYDVFSKGPGVLQLEINEAVIARSHFAEIAAARLSGIEIRTQNDGNALPKWGKDGTVIIKHVMLENAIKSTQQEVKEKGGTFPDISDVIKQFLHGDDSERERLH